MADREPVADQPLIADDATPTPWPEAREHLEQGSTYWLAMVRTDGRPHLVPVLAVWADGALHFAASATSLKAKNLVHGSRCVITTASNTFDRVLEGDAVKVRDDARLRRVADVYASKYGWHVTVRDGAFHDTEGAPTAGPPPYDVYEVTPTVAFGFGTTEETQNAATRWRF